jgi:hypothetical protein
MTPTARKMSLVTNVFQRPQPVTMRVSGNEAPRALRAPIFPPSPSNRAEAKSQFGLGFFPAAATELGSGQIFLRFFQTGRERCERGVLSVELRPRR